MITANYIKEMAAYARWQNDMLYQHCDTIGAQERLRDRGLFFGSIHNTLDHICVANRAMLTFLEGNMPDLKLQEQPFWPDWDDLKAIRLEQDDILETAAKNWTEDWLAASTVKCDPEGPDIPRWVMVVQLFNHQTHHRSQITTALHAMGVDYGVTDIVWRPGAGYFAG